MQNHCDCPFPISRGTRQGTWSADDWYNFACIFAVASRKIEDKKQEYANRALSLLQKAVDNGFRNALLLRADSNFDALRDCDDFRKLQEALGQ